MRWQDFLVEIGNTDAEACVADALAFADEKSSRYLITIATLTGAARAALGPTCRPSLPTTTLSPAGLLARRRPRGDPLWRMPLWRPYDSAPKAQHRRFEHIAEAPLPAR